MTHRPLVIYVAALVVVLAAVFYTTGSERTRRHLSQALMSSANAAGNVCFDQPIGPCPAGVASKYRVWVQSELVGQEDYIRYRDYTFNCDGTPYINVIMLYYFVTRETGVEIRKITKGQSGRFHNHIIYSDFLFLW